MELNNEWGTYDESRSSLEMMGIYRTDLGWR